MNTLTKYADIMRVKGNEGEVFSTPTRYFIDCPIDGFQEQNIKRIEIPRELARYMNELQDENRKLLEKVKDLDRQLDVARVQKQSSWQRLFGSKA